MWRGAYKTVIASAAARTTSPFFFSRFKSILTTTAAAATRANTRPFAASPTSTTTNISMSSSTTVHSKEHEATTTMTLSSTSSSSSWQQRPAALQKTFHFETYTAALQFANQVNKMSTIMDHHANMNFTHHCHHGGVDLEMTWFTYETQSLTRKDYLAARAVDLISTCQDGENQIKMEDYTYNLQESSIATFPATPRGSSKLLTVDPSGQVEYHHHFESVMPSLLSNSLVVLNDSRVLDARLYIIHDNDGNDEKIELMLLDLGDISVDTAKCQDTPLRAMIRMEMLQQGNVFTIVKPPPKDESIFEKDGDDDDGGGENGEIHDQVQVKVVDIVGIWQEDEKSDGNGMECFVCINSDLTIADFLHEAGSVPIPPYFHRAAVASDAETYNTVYAAHGGSVAAPTAGLHFTNKVLEQIGHDNTCYLSLHVGAGTFQPVMEMQDARRHAMHAETFAVPVSEIKRIIHALQQEKPIVAVGTTSTRTLESLYWCGIKYIAAKAASSDNTNTTKTVASKVDLTLGQFEWIPLNVVAATAGEKDKSNSVEGTRISRIAALQALLENFQMDNHDDTTAATVIRGRTSLMITPESYEFQMVDRLVTNFHAPDSTLMLLVSAFIKSNGHNKKIRKIYEDAQEHGFRFLSYGDSCLFSKPQS